MDCLLTLWPSASLVPLVTVTVCVAFSLSLMKELLELQPIYTQRKIIKAPLLHQSLGPWVFLSLSHSPRLIPWNTETHLAHSPAWASKTLSRRRPVPSPHLERAPSAFVRDTSPVSGTLLVFCVNQGISASFSLSLSYHRLQTARSKSIKGPQQQMRKMKPRNEANLMIMSKVTYTASKQQTEC